MNYTFPSALLVTLALTGCGVGVEDLPALGAAQATNLSKKIAGKYLLVDPESTNDCLTGFSFSAEGAWTMTSLHKETAGTFTVVNTDEELDTLVKVTDTDNDLIDCDSNSDSQIGKIDIVFFEIAEDGDLSFYAQPQADSELLMTLDRQAEELGTDEQNEGSSGGADGSNSSTEGTSDSDDTGTDTDGEPLTVAETLEARLTVALLAQEAANTELRMLARISEIAEAELAAAADRLAAANANLNAVGGETDPDSGSTDSDPQLEAYRIAIEMLAQVTEQKRLKAADAALTLEKARQTIATESADGNDNKTITAEAVKGLEAELAVALAELTTAEQQLAMIKEQAEQAAQDAENSAGSGDTDGSDTTQGGDGSSDSQGGASQGGDDSGESDGSQGSDDGGDDATDDSTDGKYTDSNQDQLNAYLLAQQQAAKEAEEKRIQAMLAAQALEAARLKAEREAAELQAAADALKDWSDAERAEASTSVEILLCNQCTVQQVKLKMPPQPDGETISGYKTYYGDVQQTSSLLAVNGVYDTSEAQFNLADLTSSQDSTLCFSTTTYNETAESFQSAPMCILTMTSSS